MDARDPKNPLELRAVGMTLSGFLITRHDESHYAEVARAIMTGDSGEMERLGVEFNDAYQYLGHSDIVERLESAVETNLTHLRWAAEQAVSNSDANGFKRTDDLAAKNNRASRDDLLMSMARLLGDVKAMAAAADRGEKWVTNAGTRERIKEAQAIFDRENSVSANNELAWAAHAQLADAADTAVLGELPQAPVDVEQLTHERDVLAKAIGDAAIKAGIVRNDVVGLTGPQLLMVANDLADCVAHFQMENSKLRKAGFEKALALQEAWTYVHGHCTIPTRREFILNVMRSDGDFADLPHINNDKDKREDAISAFWAAVVRRYPECKMDDLPPEVNKVFEVAAERVIDAWLGMNRPAPGAVTRPPRG